MKKEGDSVQKAGPIFMFGSHRNLDLYIERNLEDALALKNGELTGEKHPYLPCCSYEGKWTEFYYENET